MRTVLTAMILLAGPVLSATGEEAESMTEQNRTGTENRTGLETVTLGGGCFWCVEAIFEELDGVTAVESGYSGGSVPEPTYKEVSTGTTGHAEVVQVTFDPEVIPLKGILEVFFTTHDPTTLSRQGPDVGTQYRSVVFHRTPEQKATAEEVIREFEKEKIYDDQIVTELIAFEAFYKAENYHQEYFERNAGQPYCRAVIAPKVAKFREKFRDRLKEKE